MSVKRTPPFYAARGYRTAVQTIADNTVTQVLFTAERYDIGGFHDISTNTGRFYPPVPGYYACVALIDFAGDADGSYRAVYIRHQTSTQIFGYAEVPPASTTNRRVTAVGSYYFAYGDYAEVLVAHNAGNNLDLIVDSTFAPEFTIAFVGE